MKILILNWSDIRNPDSGGAEVLTHEMAKRWVQSGHEVTQFASTFAGSKVQEVIDGVTLVRRGSPVVRDPHIPVHVAAYLWYMRHGRRKFDVVVDEIHGIPFFTPLYVTERKVALICEVANELWDVTFPYPLNTIGKVVERKYFPIYKNIPFLTISPSTKYDLIRKGLSDSQITVLPMGLTIRGGLTECSKEKSPTLLFIGRLTKTKGVESLVDMLARVKAKKPNIHLWIAGRGDESYMKSLKDLFAKRMLDSSVTFLGFVEEKEKFEYMSRAHVLLVPSIKEGWGLIVPEAGYMGTPTVAYDVPGLRDVVKDKYNGLLVNPNSHDLAMGVLTLLKDKKLYTKLQNGARSTSRKYSWDNTANIALALLQQSVV